MKSKKVLIIIFGILVFLCLFYFCTGFFVVQPIGALPEGATIWYFRAGLNLPFVVSADGLLLQIEGDVSLFGRAMALTGIMSAIEGRIILRLPFSRILYLITTDGQEFDS